MKKTRKKYRIAELLEELSAKDLAIAKTWLPKQIGVSQRTFEDWKYIPENSDREIPFDKAFKIASFFKVDISELFTSVPANIDLQEMKEVHAQEALNNILKS